MNDRKRTIMAVTILVLVFVVIVGVVLVLFSKKPLVSPIPDEGAIKIIFVTPTPQIVVTPTEAPLPTLAAGKKAPTKTPTKSPTRAPTSTPTTKRTPTPTATPEP